MDRKLLNEVTRDTRLSGRWADSLYAMTPVEQKSDSMFYKRDDFYAPLGINSINGSKLRQLVWLFDREDPSKVDTVVSATNVAKSPQVIMTPAVAEHYGYRCINVAGGTNFNSINKKEMPMAATMFGAKYDIVCRSGFNVNIQKRAQLIMADLPRSFNIERDITLHHNNPANSAADLREFHSVGAQQVKNIPSDIEAIIMPFGSATSCTSVLLGLSEWKPFSLKTIHLVNVGVDKREEMFYRLELMGADISMYDFVWHDTQVPYDKLLKGVSVDDITFHCRYEAKVYQYLLDSRPDLINERNLYWVIGSYPSTAVTAANLGREVPTEVTLYKGE